MTLLGEATEMVSTNWYEWVLLFAFIVIGILYAVILCAYIKERNITWKNGMFLCLILMLCVVNIVFFTNRVIRSQTICYYSIDDDVSYSDIVDHYDVIERHGNLIVLRDKEKTE